MRSRRKKTMYAMRVEDREEWARRCIEALVFVEGHIPAAAQLLGVAVRTMKRWVAESPELTRAPRAPRGRPVAC